MEPERAIAIENEEENQCGGELPTKRLMKCQAQIWLTQVWSKMGNGYWLAAEEENGEWGNQILNIKNQDFWWKKMINRINIEKKLNKN